MIERFACFALFAPSCPLPRWALSLLGRPSTMEASPAPRSRSFPRLRGLSQVFLLALLLTLGATALVTAAPGPTPAYAANVSIDQCNNIGPSPQGATTVMNCTVTVVNTVDAGRTSSTVTVTRLCALGPCPPGNGTETTSSTDLVTNVTQCNGSGNDAAHPITCNVDIINNISADTPGASPVTPATVNQCVGSGGGGGGTVACLPFPATTTSATVTQCNGSANGGGGTVACTVGSASTVSPAIAVTVNQCNGSGNPGGSTVTCRTSLVTNIIAVAAPTSAPASSPVAPTASTSAAAPPVSATAAPSASAPVVPTTSASAPTAPAPSGSVAASVSPTEIATDSPVEDLTSQVTQVPRGGVQTGAGSTDGRRQIGLLSLGGLLLAAAAAVMAYRRRLTRAVDRAGR